MGFARTARDNGWTIEADGDLIVRARRGRERIELRLHFSGRPTAVLINGRSVRGPDKMAQAVAHLTTPPSG